MILLTLAAGLLLGACAQTPTERGSASGVTASTVLLDGPDKHAYLLLGTPSGQLQAGTRVEVVGRPVDQLASFCGEGTALSVVSVRPLR